VRRAFADGVFWIDMGKKPDPLARLSDIGVYFGDVKAEYHDIPRAKQRLSTILRDKRVLIIVDDVWDYKHADAFRLADTRSRIMITTRLTSLATQLSVHGTPLGTLTSAEGMALFIERLGYDLNVIYAECHEIIRLLGGHTLAVSIAAGYLSEEGIGYAPNLLRRLKKGKTFSTLRLHNYDKDLNLEKSLYVSYESLSPDMQRRFRLTGVFAADEAFDEIAVRAVWGDNDQDDTHDALKTLVSAGILERHERQYYSRHTLLRAYARALAPVTELYDAQAIHFSFYETRHTQSGKDYLNYHKEIEADLENLHDALMWGFEAETVRTCNLLLVALNGYYFNYQPVAYRLLLESSLPILAHGGESFSEVQALNTLTYLDEDDDTFTSKTDTQTISNLNQTGARIGYANALKTLGDLSVSEHDLSAARNFYLRALSVYQMVDVWLGQADTLYALGKLSINENNSGDAHHFYHEALAIYDRMDNHTGLINIYANMAHMYRKAGELEAAKTHYEYALALASGLSPSYTDHQWIQSWRTEYNLFVQNFR